LNQKKERGSILKIEMRRDRRSVLREEGEKRSKIGLHYLKRRRPVSITRGGTKSEIGGGNDQARIKRKKGGTHYRCSGRDRFLRGKKEKSSSARPINGGGKEKKS